MLVHALVVAALSVIFFGLYTALVWRSWERLSSSESTDVAGRWAVRACGASMLGFLISFLLIAAELFGPKYAEVGGVVFLVALSLAWKPIVRMERGIREAASRARVEGER